MLIAEQDYLEHFGVKGMKWGVRKDVETSGSTKGSKSVNGVLKKHGNSKVGEAADFAPLAIYGGVIAALIISQVVKLRADSGRKDAKKSGDAPFKENPKLKQKMSVSQLHNNVVKQINPDYPGAGTQMNCRRATMAYEMRRRGFDVKATKSLYASGQTEKGLKKANNMDKKEKWESLWGEKRVSNPTEFNASTPEKKAQLVFDSISKHPNGARGELGLAWTFGGGHSMAWEVVNNKPVVFDTQNSKVYSSPKAFSSFTPTVYEVAQTRLDTTTINDEFIRRWVTNVD